MKTYEEVADKVLKDSPRTYKWFVAYMRKRWGDPKDEAVKCQVGYAEEWADRFRMGVEYEMSDSKGKRILEDMQNAKEVGKLVDGNGEYLQSDPNDWKFEAGDFIVDGKW